jgi:hypothetical protein
MNQRNHTSTLAAIYVSRWQCWRRSVYASRRDDRQWLRILTSALVLASILLGPVGSIPAYALDVPALSAPTDGSTITVVESPPLGIPEFAWAAVTGATSYRLQVSSDIAFTTTILNVLTPNTTYTPISASVFADGTWYWRVRAEAPSVGEYSGIWSFTKQWATPANSPALISPTDSATIDFYDQPVFSWDPVMGAAKYKFQIYASPGGWSTLTYTATTLATTHQPNAKLANGTYYWRVVPVDPGNRDGTPSAERYFTASYNLIPTLLKPDHLATPTFTPTFSWTAVRGAQYYRLQYSTDPSFMSSVTEINTRNTAYTPTATLSNDVNYYWRVKVYSGSSISDWSSSRSFIKKWYIKPVLLTPTNNYQDQRFPIFSWTPVPGASYYKVELSLFPGFSPLYTSGTTANTFYSPAISNGGLAIYYWRVTPYDGNANKGQVSNTSSYRSYQESVAPHQVYPLFYYLPDTYSGFPGVTTNPHEDRTVPLPIFIWHRVFVPIFDADQGQVYAEAYRLQVSTDPLFGSVNWTVDTENTVAAPTAANPFTPIVNTDYFWRVCPLISGICTLDSLSNELWSQRWTTRINPSPDLFPRLTPTTGAVPTLIRPTKGFEFAETTPLLEWFPISGASSYDVEISLDQSFSSTVDTATVSSPAYAPTQSLAQRSLGDVDFGVYYWRVRQSPSGGWSETWRFQIAAQSQWKNTRTLGDIGNQLQIGSDPASDVADPDYDLTSLQVAQSSGFWYFGFHVPASPGKNVTYALYLDLDHQDSSGATCDAWLYDGCITKFYNVTTIPAYRPEYAIYILQEAGAFTATKVYLYKWNGSDWDTVNVLNNIGGNISYSAGYVELELPNTAIGYQDTTGSYAVSLFSLPATSGQPQDSVPSDPNIPGSGLISRFANVTERMNLSMPPNDAGVDPSTYPSILPFFWDWPILSPWSGAIMKAYLDPLFTTEAATYTLTSDGAYYARTSHAWEDDFNGDNTYYWRIQPRYRPTLVGGILVNGAWSQGWRFERQGFIPQNLGTSVTSATPTFSWDMVEGAEYYELQVDDDPGFGTMAINISTRQNSYTHQSTLPNATYYWRVRVRRNGGVTNNWTSNQSFTLALPTPTGLTPPSDPPPVGPAPTLCWTPLMYPLAGDPVLAAWKYRVQVSKEPTFTSPFDNIDTEQSCWTPIKGYDDGQYYWRAAMSDGDGRWGNYSAYQTFTKTYPSTDLLIPASGAILTSTPTFVWESRNGAAKYRLEVSQFPTFSPTYDSITTDNIRYTPNRTYATGITYYWRVAIVDSDGKYGPWVEDTIILPAPGPSVVSSVRVHPDPTDRASVGFTVTFSEAVTGVDKTDFALTKTGSITGASVTGVTAVTSAIYTVTVNTGSGNGTLRLDILNNGSIKNAALLPLSGAFTSGQIYTVNKTITLNSIAAQDGWVLEKSHTSNTGGSLSATSTTLRLGDDKLKKQYRSILSFKTSGLPDTAVITSITLKIKQQSVTGGATFKMFQGLLVDIRKGIFGTSALKITDFQATASKPSVGPFTAPAAGGWYTFNLTTAKAYINKAATNSGLTQFRLRFKLDDNNNGIANYISFYSGNSATNKPTLIIQYYVP